MREDRHKRAVGRRQYLQGRFATTTYLMPTPPAMRTRRFMLFVSGLGGGQVKLPPTLTTSCVPIIVSSDCQSHRAGGFLLFWMASSRNGAEWVVGLASLGVDVMVKPPAERKPGMNVSSH